MNLSSDAVQTLLTLIISAGGAAFLTQLVRGWISLRSGARASTREVIRDLAAARDEAEEREGILRRDLEYYRSVAGTYEYQLRSNGIEPRPPHPSSPSERGRAQRDPRGGTVRRSRAEQAPPTEDIHWAAETDE